MDEREHEINEVKMYVEGQMLDVTVTSAQRVFTRRIMGTDHEVWDVRVSDDTRWWVISNPLNYYDATDFANSEQALIFHIGLSIVMREQHGQPIEDGVRDLLGAAWRRLEQAEKAHRQAHEAAEFQAVGIHCRETLLSLAAAICEELPAGTATPDLKAADFVGWATLGAKTFTSGRLRQYLTTIIKPAWDLAVSLQHYNGATTWDSSLAMTATEHVIAMMSQAILRSREEPKRTCPRCESRWVDVAFGIYEDGPAHHWNSKICVACRYEWERAEWLLDENDKSIPFEAAPST